MWGIAEPDDKSYQADLKRLGRKHALEFSELFKRVKELLQHLNDGMNHRDALSPKWVHHKYSLGMKSLAGGGRKGQAALRLYIYPDLGKQRVVILGIGDKSSQDRDVKQARKVLAFYLAEAAEEQ